MGTVLLDKFPVRSPDRFLDRSFAKTDLITVHKGGIQVTLFLV